MQKVKSKGFTIIISKYNNFEALYIKKKRKYKAVKMHFDTLDIAKPEPSVKVKLTKRTILTVKEKYEICQFKDGHPNYSHQNVADHFTSRWGKKISRRVIGDIIADRHKWTEECEESTTRNVKRYVYSCMPAECWLDAIYNAVVCCF